MNEHLAVTDFSGSGCGYEGSNHFQELLDGTTISSFSFSPADLPYNRARNRVRCGLSESMAANLYDRDALHSEAMKSLLTSPSLKVHGQQITYEPAGDVERSAIGTAFLTATS